MIQRFYRRLKNASVKSWLTAGGWLTVGLLPCPDCGTPMVFHIWPIVGMVLIARAAKKRRLAREAAGQADSGGEK